MYAIIIYGFPLFLIAVEIGLRSLLGVDASAFIGPTIAAAGLSFLMPLTKPRIIDISNPGGSNSVVMTRSEYNFIPIVWFLVFVFLLAWPLTTFIAIKYPTDITFHMSSHLFIGLVLYAISVIMSLVKEYING